MKTTNTQCSVWKRGAPAVAALFLVLQSWKRFGFGGELVTALALLFLLLKIACNDWKTMKIPNRSIAFLMIPVSLSCVFGPFVPAQVRLAGLAAVSLPMAVMNRLIRGSFGGGDIKLMAVCGLLLGWRGIGIAAFLAVLTGGFYGLRLLAIGKMERGGHFAFGPFLAVGIFTSFLYGEELLAWYMGFLYW